MHVDVSHDQRSVRGSLPTIPHFSTWPIQPERIHAEAIHLRHSASAAAKVRSNIHVLHLLKCLGLRGKPLPAA